MRRPLVLSALVAASAAGSLSGCAALAVGGAIVSTTASGVSTVTSTAVGVTTSAAGVAVDVVTPSGSAPKRP
ncbi:hypothetical protein GWI72_06020 [Microvirga tunisiensis]|uniref:Uncharacterized protein n=2 Tax=Pannonibacter tanglangensis TaxID=2750084 RepID=A0A7X5F121_9HYPH|nr:MULTISPECIES: hypothetical protein [unclassified Pannonibacter]NBN62155.1 hypothetical protein [Pannonibacter sp. XCT-34]NBN77823.1 hypothetical protein [Pannonibacter sp. XCT-53]